MNIWIKKWITKMPAVLTAGLIIVMLSLMAGWGMAQTPPAAPAGAPAPAAAGSGEKIITLTMTDTPLNQLLSVIGDTFGIGVVASRGATGNVNVSLNNATLEQALDSITQPNGWTWVRKENTITIMTKAEYDEYMKGNVITKTFYLLNTNAQEVQNTIQPLITTAGKIIRDDRTNLLQITDTPESLARIEQIIQSLDVPIDVEVIPLKYAVAADVKAQADKIKTAKGDIQIDERTNTLIVTDVPSSVEKLKKLIESLDIQTLMEVFDIQYAKPKDIMAAVKDLLTKKGYIQIDERNSRVVVDDIPSHMEKIRKVIEAMDQPDRLVFIEAEIVDMDYDKSLDLGIDWSYGASFNLTNSTTNSTVNFPLKGWNAFRNAWGAASASQIGLSLSATAKAISKLGTNNELLASPRVMVKNDEEAKFLVGGTQPYTVVSNQLNNGVNQQYYSQVSQEYGIKLTVKPHINANGVIDMKVSLENTSADPVTLNGGGYTYTGVATKTSKADTQVSVHNNETVVVGGLVSRNKTESGSGIPLLESIPFLGHTLFGSSSKDNQKRNLLLFMTPHLVTGKRADTERVFPEAYKTYTAATSEPVDKEALKKKYLKSKGKLQDKGLNSQDTTLGNQAKTDDNSSTDNQLTPNLSVQPVTPPAIDSTNTNPAVPIAPPEVNPNTPVQPVTSPQINPNIPVQPVNPATSAPGPVLPPLSLPSPASPSEGK